MKYQLPFFNQFFENEDQKYSAYFVLFILAALFNGFNVRDEKFGIFKGLNLNPEFLKVWFAIVIVQTVHGFKNVLFGGEGLFLTRITGPGKVILQTQNIKEFAGVLSRYLPSGNSR